MAGRAGGRDSGGCGRPAARHAGDHTAHLHSACTQPISLAADSPRLDFETTLDRRKRHILLKVAFPVDILAPVATYEIQYGNVQQPTHRNTRWRLIFGSR